MGLAIFDALKNSANSQLGDQWREYFYCDSMDNSVLMTKGKRRVNNQKTSNKHGIDNIITNGSIIAVNEGQCMIIVEDGRIAEFCAEPGQFIYDSSAESTILYGDFKENVSKTWETFKKRASFGGDTGTDQRIYYFNTKEIMKNPFGTATPIPFRVVDRNIGLDMDTLVRCHGTYNFRIVDPILFYRSIAGNVRDTYYTETLADQMKLELVEQLSPALGAISAKGIRYNEISNYPNELKAAVSAQLSEQWTNQRGIALVNIAISPMRLPEDIEKMINSRQMTATLRDPGMAGAYMTEKLGNAAESAGANESGAVHGFMGMGMAMNAAGALNPANFFAMAQQNQQQQQNMAFAGMAPQQPMQGQQMYQQPQQPQMAQPQQATPAPQAAPVGWTCTCGTAGNTGKFCRECGAKRVEPAVGWTCSCGAVNTGKFCMECGSKKPADAPLYKCDKCGWEPEDPKNPPKFCPECGDPFDDSDIQ